MDPLLVCAIVATFIIAVTSVILAYKVKRSRRIAAGMSEQLNLANQQRCEAERKAELAKDHANRLKESHDRQVARASVKAALLQDWAKTQGERFGMLACIPGLGVVLARPPVPTPNLRIAVLTGLRPRPRTGLIDSGMRGDCVSVVESTFQVHKVVSSAPHSNRCVQFALVVDEVVGVQQLLDEVYPSTNSTA